MHFCTVLLTLLTMTAESMLSFQFCTALLSLLTMTADSMLLKRPVLRVAVTLFFLLNISFAI